MVELIKVSGSCSFQPRSPCYNTPMVWFLVIVIISWLAGNLVNYLADFLPIERKLVSSYCLNCKSPRNITNYLFFPRPCASCKQRVPNRWWIVNISFILISIYLYLNPSEKLEYWQQVILLVYLILVAVIDLEHRLILHVVSVAGAFIGLYVGILLHGWESTLIGGISGLIIMYLLYLGGHLFIKILAKRRNYSDIDEALGFGDVILSGVIGLILGWPGIMLGLILAVLLAGIVSLFFLAILLLTHRYRANLTIAYGPYLILSTLILVLFRDVLRSLQ